MNIQGFLKIIDKIKLPYVLVLFLIFYSHNSIVNAQEKDFTIVLDAGHGGKDPGRPTKNGYKEKDIVLKIVLAIGKKLEKEPNIKVIYTRKKDIFIDLFKRGQIANKANADLFVSIHCNAHHTQAYGTETYVLGIHRNNTNFNVAKAENSVILLEDNHEENYKGFDPNAPESLIGLTLMQEEYLDQSISFASMVQNNFTKVLKRKDRGVKQAGFIVLHQTYMPSVLIEAGFITNKKEGAFLNSKKGQEKIAENIFTAIKQYKLNIDKNKVIEPEVKENTSNDTIKKPTEKEIADNVVFKVQIASGSRKLATKSYNFKGLKNIERIKFGSIYRYYYGKATTYTEIQKQLKIAKNKGYNTAFIVAYKDGKKVSVKEVLKTQTQ